MESELACPICTMTDIVIGDDRAECITCGHEWDIVTDARDNPGALGEIRDANGTVLHDGDSVAVIKDLKLKGSSDTLKVGTKISNIRLVAGDHEVDCKVAGRGILLKAKFLRKV
ncbi:MAG: zinc ribbon domain-containing protein YjdM [Actinomycetota bacterium]|nr:zinc ribbon domain-containing protein YjdM [Actinomycetota bacterium]